MANISINQLADEITQAVKSYTEDVTAGIENEVKCTADKILDETKRLAPRHTGKYAKSFKITDKSLPGNKKYVIWNKKHFWLVHLLEFGHTKIGGGRVSSRPHLRPAHDKHAGHMEENIKRIIRNGG